MGHCPDDRSNVSLVAQPEADRCAPSDAESYCRSCFECLDETAPSRVDVRARDLEVQSLLQDRDKEEPVQQTRSRSLPERSEQ